MAHDRNLFGCQVFDATDLPAGWTCESLGDRMEFAYGRGLRTDRREPGDILVFGSNGPVGTHCDSISDGPGVLVGRKGSVGAVHFTEQAFWAIDTVYYVVPKKNDRLKYLYYLLQYLPLKNLNAATGVPGLSRRDAYALRGSFPPLEQQDQIVNALSSVDTSIQALAGAEGLRMAQEPLFGDRGAIRESKGTTASGLAALIALRRSLMHGLLTGRLAAEAVKP